MENIRINKYLAMCEVGSRRKCEEYIKEGKVSVNGNIVTELGMTINPDSDKVCFNKKQVKIALEQVYYVLNKPVGIISAAKSKYGEKTVVDLIDDKKNRLFPVGRLDKDTTGLIILTNDGELTHKLTHPKFEKEKTYEAFIKGNIETKEILKLSKGITLDGKMTSKAKVRIIKMIGKNSLIEITLIEGRNRQVKKMCEKVGHNVISLKRTKEAGLTLGSLNEGEYRKLNDKEIERLKNGVYNKKR